jgi:hypothetical protein
MRFQFLVIPAAASATILAAVPARATSFLSVEQAQHLIFPRASFAAADILLTDAQAEDLARVSGATVYRNQVKVWKASTGGWLFLDQVPGRDDRITYAVGINPDGAIKGIEVLVCVGDYDQVRGPWRGLFNGKRFHRTHLSTEVPSISGATLSAGHMSDGITRILATYALFFAPKQG